MSEQPKPTLEPGLYRLRPRPGRLWSADELELIQIDGEWHVVPRVVLARLPAGCVLRADGTIREAAQDERPHT